MELLLGTSRPWPAFPLIAFVSVYFLSKTKLAGTIIGQCVLMFADALVRNVASQLETDQNFEAFFFLHSPYPDGPLIIIIIIIIFFFFLIACAYMLVRGGIASWRRFCCDSLHVGARGGLLGRRLPV